MARIKEIASGEVFEVAADPQWVGGIWECGNMRFTDPTGNLYEVVSINPPSEADYAQAVQQHLDDFARTRNYDGILSACTYATSSVPQFAAEGQYCVSARDTTWATCYAVMGEVLAGTRSAPTIAELLDMLPVLTWPE